MKYYLLNTSGTVVRSSTIDSSGGAKFPNISGDNDKVYIVYKLGSNLKASYTTNAGQSWNNIIPQSIGNNTCNGVDIAYDSRGLHVVYATQEAWPDFETYYYKLNATNNWVDYKNVTDGSGEESEYGGLPRIALSSNKVHVVYSNTGDEFVENDYCLISSRDKNLVNNTWENALLAFQAQSTYFVQNQQIIIDYNNTEYLFFYLTGSTPPDPSRQEWLYRTRPIDGSWFGLGNLPPEENQDMTFSLCLNTQNKVNTFHTTDYTGIRLLYWTIIENGQIIGDYISSEIHPRLSQLKSSSVSNDLFLVWRNEGSNYLSYQQYDEVPFAPQNFTITQSTTAHPLLSWSKNNEPDIDYYVIEKLLGELGWQPIDSTANPYYEDVLETYCTSRWCMAGHYVWYRIKAVDYHPYESLPSEELGTMVNGFDPYKISYGFKVPSEYSLAQNFPNPFNPTTKISYSLQKEGLVTMKVFDVLGHDVAALVNEVKPEGFYEAEFNASNLPSGVYIYKMQAGKFTAVNKMILMR